MRLFLSSIVFLLLATACKKEVVQPDPISGKVITKKSTPMYSGYIETKLFIEHRSGNVMDTSLFSYISLFDAVIADPTSTVSLNGYAFSSGNSAYSLSLSSTDVANPFLFEFRSLNYSGILAGAGSFTMTDNRSLATFSNKNLVPLNFSKSNGYSFTLNNVAYSDAIEARIGVNQAYRNISIQNPKFRFYESELLNTAVGSQTDLEITLISQRDTVINNKNFFMQKNVCHRYALTFTN